MLWRKASYNFREAGLSGLASKCAVYVHEALWSDSQWLIYEKTFGDGELSVPPRVVRRELGFGDLFDVGYFKAQNFPEAMQHRMESGAVCHGFFFGDRLATIGWTTSNYLELDVSLRVSCPGSAGLFDFYTYKEFRARGYYTNALMQLFVVARDAGFAKACIAVDPSNVASIKAIERAGFQRLRRITKRRRFGVSRVIKEEILR